MPRSAKDTGERILAVTKQFITDNPDETVSIRKIASLCGVSPGTIYNHYPDKDHLMAAVMMEDWHKVLKEMEEFSRKADSFRQGTAGIYASLCGFVDSFQTVWRDYRASADYALTQHKRHIQLIREISVSVKALLERFAAEEDINLADLLAENILNAAVYREISLETLLQLCVHIAE